MSRAGIPLPGVMFPYRKPFGAGTYGGRIGCACRGIGRGIVGAAQQYRLFAYVTIGTGIASTLVQDRVPFAGAHGNAILMASSPLTTVCSHCGTVLAPVVEEIRIRDLPSSQRITGIRIRNLIRAEERGDCAAEAGRWRSAASREKSGTDPGGECWVSHRRSRSGGASGRRRTGSRKAASIVYVVESTREHWANSTRNLPILCARAGQRCRFIGAAAGFWQKQNAPPG